MSIIKVNGLAEMSDKFGKDADLVKAIKQVGLLDTPFFSTIAADADSRADADISSAHTWRYRVHPDGELDNAAMEGADFAAPVYYDGGELKNHYQIVRNGFGVTGSAEKAAYTDGKPVLTQAQLDAQTAHRKTLNKILLSAQAPVQRVNTGATSALKAGKLGGIKNFATTENTIDATDLEFGYDMLIALLQIGDDNGGQFTHLICNTAIKNKIDKILKDWITNVSMGQSWMGINVRAIQNVPYANSVKVLVERDLAQNEIIVYRPQEIHKVFWRPTKVYEKARTSDALQKQVLSELTLRIDTPYSFAWLKNIGAST
jgi:hypothetical protein